MIPIRVWAPGARRGEVVTGGAPVPMERSGAYLVAHLPPETDYAISLDGGPALPDPRSAAQPYGVHGPSRTFDAGCYRWQSERSVDALGALTYELHVGTFTAAGTLDAAAERLDHLSELGVELVELLPLAPFPGTRGWGYDGVGLYGVHHAYGGPAALQRFVDAAHTRGIGVCLDVVYNHLGPAGNYLARFAPYFTPRHLTPWGEGFDVDGENAKEVRAFIIDAALRWFHDFRVDALRLDAVHEIADSSPQHILAELSERVRQLSSSSGRPLRLIAESDTNDIETITPTSQGGLGLDGQWADDVHHALHAYLTGEDFGYYCDFASPQALRKALEDVFVHDGTFSTFRGTTWGKPVPRETDRRRFVAYLENHDQIGNRAFGDRPLAGRDGALAAQGAALLLLAPCTPLIFQGSEWATARPFRFFTDHGSDIGDSIAEGRRQEFRRHGWPEQRAALLPDPQDPDTFTASVLDWGELERPAARRMLRWYRELAQLRRSTFGDGAAHQNVTCSYGDGWFAMRRGPLTVLVAPHAAARCHLEGELVLSWGEVREEAGELLCQQGSCAVVRTLQP